MKVKVKFIRPVYPYKSWDIGYIDEKKAKHLKNQVEIVQKDNKEKEDEKEENREIEEVKPEKKRKQVKKKSNKAVLRNNNTKWL